MKDTTNRHATGEIYHVFTKSIAGYKIFNDEEEYNRMVDLLDYYKFENVYVRYSNSKNKSTPALDTINKIIQLIAYCIMPTHIHLILKQSVEHGISKYMNKCLNSHTRYFNIKHKRKGPLWESRFKSVRITNNELFLHITRYVHLNPSTAGLVINPIDWEHSSYREYISTNYEMRGICDIDGLIELGPKMYKDFVESQIDYQRKLALIKHLIIE